MHSFDTSGFLDAWVRHYPPDIFHSFWRQMEKSVTQEIIKVSDEVLEELERKDDGAGDWIRDRPTMIVPTDENIQREVSRILAIHPRLVNAGKRRSGGDPFVIAVARLNNYTVITGESGSGRLSHPKIPDVCSSLGVPCINLLDSVRQQGWRI
jgi:hypothetical protein